MTQQIKPTVFIDRDGTINYDAGYINHPDSFIMYPFAPQAVKMLNDAGYLTIIITNQSGLARGFFDIDTMNAVHAKMNGLFAANGARIDALYYCPHDPNAKIAEYKGECNCRKPKTGMTEKAFAEMPIDKNKTYFIGDKHSDIMAGHLSGSKTIMVETGYGKGDLLKKSTSWEVQPDAIAPNFLEAVRMILSDKV